MKNRIWPIQTKGNVTGIKSYGQGFIVVVHEQEGDDASSLYMVSCNQGPSPNSVSASKRFLLIFGERRRNKPNMALYSRYDTLHCAQGYNESVQAHRAQAGHRQHV